MSPGTPAAEVEIDERLVRALLAEQHPDLAGLPLRHESNGWDNVMFRLGDEPLLRLPRREAALELIRNEQAWLPGLAHAEHVPSRDNRRTGRRNTLQRLRRRRRRLAASTSIPMVPMVKSFGLTCSWMEPTAG